MTPFHSEEQAVQQRIPAAKALIGCNTNAAGRISEVFVIPDGRGEEWGRTGIPRKWHDAAYSWGACFSEWLKPGHHDMTPEWIFGEILTFYGCADSRVVEQAINAFATIEECAWARAMQPTKPVPAKPFWSLA
jgi:hypothetical protein